MKVKLIFVWFPWNLEKKVNEFIKGKEIIDIKMGGLSLGFVVKVLYK